MTHAYELYITVEVPCLCCRSVQPFQFTSPSDQVVCTHCVNHLGTAKAERRDTEHVALWAGILNDQQSDSATFVAASLQMDAENEALIADLTTQLNELTDSVASDFSRAPTGKIRDSLTTELVTRAERTTALAYRRLDRTMTALWRVNALHHDDPNKAGFCSCGKKTAACAEGLAIDGERQELASWERKNIQLLQNGERHGLPADHPAVTAALPAAKVRR
ncbi:MAG: hypothetical protein JWQ43_3742 [Glaciihabitans sp.]|nr:hypothetical protein [Glaciihabitans sp.]